VLGLLSALLLLVAGCDRQKAVSPSAQSGEMPDQEVQDFVLTETDQGRLQWKLYARYAAMYDSRNVITARGVRVDFYGEDEKKTSELTAREGEINQSSRDMTATGNVVLQTTEGTRMSTEQLRFVNATQRIVSDQLVRIERAGDELTGVGFESDPDLSRYEFKRQVSATVRTRTGGLLEPRRQEKP
jgi:LPS export ABC transporter protein LptC